ncbi:Related to galactose oxidase [Echinococcus multilocularis]|uniref:Related to galactose oxidase n=1 Tax=Echinococcus multilocularis TaxID=6211 RepID=A0A0S4MNL3_ECHMU|nr:Related to galactose oxidase [Echinococcus multilocularis]
MPALLHSFCMLFDPRQIFFHDWTSSSDIVVISRAAEPNSKLSNSVRSPGKHPFNRCPNNRYIGPNSQPISAIKRN